MSKDEIKRGLFVALLCDAHIHLLPALDSGADTEEESKNMLSMMKDAGVMYAIACPVLSQRKDTVSTFLCKRNAAINRLKHNTKIKILGSCELEYFSGISRMEELDDLICEKYPALPLSLPYGRYTSDIIAELAYILQKRHIPLMILHCERYSVFLNEKEKSLLFSLPYTAYQFTLASMADINQAKLALTVHRSGKQVILASNAHHAKSRAPLYEAEKLHIDAPISKIAYETLLKSTNEHFKKKLL